MFACLSVCMQVLGGKVKSLVLGKGFSLGTGNQSISEVVCRGHGDMAFTVFIPKTRMSFLFKLNKRTLYMSVFCLSDWMTP